MRPSRAAGGLAVVVGLVAALPVFAQSSNDVQIRLLGRIQYQFNTTSVRETDLVSEDATSAPVIAASTFETRRVRFGALLTFDEWLTAMLEPEYALGNLALRQVWIDLEIDPRFALRFGQFKKPFGLLQLTSSTTHPFIERGVRIRGLHDAYAVTAEGAGVPQLGVLDGDVLLGEEQELLDRMGYQGYDMGAVAHGELGRFGYTVGVFNGSGSDTRDDTDGKGYTGRITYALAGVRPLVLGAAVSRQDLSLGGNETATGTAFELDAEFGAFRAPGLHALAEVVTGDNLAVDERFTGAQLVLAWFAPTTHARVQGIEPIGRVSFGDPNREIEGDDGLLLTPGVNLYFTGRTRLMLNWDFFVPGDDRFETVHGLKAQAQIAF